jgi:ribosomal protein L40E
MKSFQIGFPNWKSLPRKPPLFSFIPSCLDLHYNSGRLDILPCDAMPSNRPNLTLDEQSFQSLLSAAFTIQEHSKKLNQARPAQAEPVARPEPDANRYCQHCGATVPPDASLCKSCGTNEFRPGERLQRNWASMWLMSQEQELWPEGSAENGNGTRMSTPLVGAEHWPGTHDFSTSGAPALPAAGEAAKETIRPEKAALHDRARGQSAFNKLVPGRSTQDPAPAEPASDTPMHAEAGAEQWMPEVYEDLARQELVPVDTNLAAHSLDLSASDLSIDDSHPVDTAIDAATEVAPRTLRQRIADFHVKLVFHRADLYLGVSIFVAAVALLWPAARSPQPAGLGAWERALITLGVAEAPAPVVHLQGDPGLQVWVDPHTALYYCPGEEQYGKTADGRLSSQREAQMDRFEPAGHLACD